MSEQTFGGDPVMPQRHHGSLFDVVGSVMEPGENIGYVELLRRLKERMPSFNRVGIGTALDFIEFRGCNGNWRDAECVTYRVPVFDDEVVGDWTEGELRIVRRGATDDLRSSPKGSV